MTAPLWHGNDDPPKVGDHIKYILRGMEYEGYYWKIGLISRGKDSNTYEKGKLIDHMQDVSQWRLASSGE